LSRGDYGSLGIYGTIIEWMRNPYDCPQLGRHKASPYKRQHSTKFQSFVPLFLGVFGLNFYISGNQ
jgi:hypothetical protein